MQRLALAFITVAFVSAGCAGRPSLRELKPSDPALADLAFLSGSWSSEHEGLRFDEHWAPPSGGTMLGVSRVVKDQKTVFHEFVLLEHTTEGTFFRVRTESANETVSFKRVATTSTSPRAVTFENPAHDFPNRITYWPDGEDTLRAKIEGTRDGKAASEEFVFYRSVVSP